jgi:uncharacterized protein (TIGR02001 family)
VKKLSPVLVLCGLASIPAAAFADAAATPDYTLTANVGLVSQYLYRGITQSAGNPAIQGGVDYTDKNGFYVGTWGSSISWISDNYGATTGADGLSPEKASASMEWDIYGGYRGSVGPFSYDVGVLQYWYPGRYGNLTSSQVRADTTELYAALSKDWLSLKGSCVVSKGLFGTNNADGSYYLDLTANYPVIDTLTLNAHVGYQKFEGSNGGVPNSDLYTFPTGNGA